MIHLEGNPAGRFHAAAGTAIGSLRGLGLVKGPISQFFFSLGIQLPDLIEGKIFQRLGVISNMLVIKAGMGQLVFLNLHLMHKV